MPRRVKPGDYQAGAYQAGDGACPASCTPHMHVGHELLRFAAAGAAHAAAYGADYEELWSALGRAAGSGKRLRSHLLQAAYHAHGGTDHRAPARVGAAIELLHTAFIIHDDVIDRDVSRRGVPNVSGTFVRRAASFGAEGQASATLGLAAGVLAGDLGLCAAVAEVALCGAAPDVVRRLLDQLTDAVRISAAGELDDVVMSIGDRETYSLGDVLTMAERKTAVYSFQLPLRAGAVLAGATDQQVEALGTVGRLAGIGFQLVDDLRGVFADEATTGKSALGDLREGKLTALITHARGTEAWDDIRPHLGDATLDDERAGVVRQLLERCGSRAFVEELAESYVSAALRTAEEAQVPVLLREELGELCHRILGSAA